MRSESYLVEAWGETEEAAIEEAECEGAWGWEPTATSGDVVFKAELADDQSARTYAIAWDGVMTGDREQDRIWETLVSERIVSCTTPVFMTVKEFRLACVEGKTEFIGFYANAGLEIAQADVLHAMDMGVCSGAWIVVGTRSDKAVRS